MKLYHVYSLLILTKNTKKVKKNNFKTQKKKSEIVIFPGRILPCKQASQQYTALVYTTYSHVLDGEINAIAANWCFIVRTWGIQLQLIVCPTLGRRHQHVAQCCRNIQPSFSKCLGIQKVCLGFRRIHRNVDKKIF